MKHDCTCCGHRLTVEHYRESVTLITCDSFFCRMRGIAGVGVTEGDAMAHLGERVAGVSRVIAPIAARAGV